MFSRYMLVVLFVGMVHMAGVPFRAAAQAATYTDPFTYCAAVGTIDAPDARYVGPAVPETIAAGLRDATESAPDTPLDQLASNSFWRCMDGAVYGCTVGANLPCQDQADTSQTPTPAMVQFCQSTPNDDIPADVTGGATVYEWACQNGVATPGQQVYQVDAQGFISNIWYKISAQGGAAAQTLPSAGGLTGLATHVSYVTLGVCTALLGLVLRRRAYPKH